MLIYVYVNFQEVIDSIMHCNMEQCKKQIFQNTERSITTMPLNFFGRGSGFADEHTSAYFTTADKEIVIIDCPVTTFQKLKHIDLMYYKKIYVLVTHTHGDHIGGLGLFVQYAFFTLKKPITIVAPSVEVANDILTILTIEGNLPSWCELVTVANVKEKEWFGECILTKHSPQLESKCFGYHLTVDSQNIVYTGDTSTIVPFLPYLVEGSILYVDTSVYYGMIHLKLEDALADFLALNAKGVKVYLMHLDDVAAAKKIVANYPNIEVVTIES